MKRTIKGFNKTTLQWVYPHNMPYTKQMKRMKHPRNELDLMNKYKILKNAKFFQEKKYMRNQTMALVVCTSR